MSLLKSIAIKTKPRAAMQEQDFVEITVEKGIKWWGVLQPDHTGFDSGWRSGRD